VHDWAEVHRLVRAGVPKAAIARTLGMSRNTVDRLAALATPPAYHRPSKGSILDPHKDRVAELLGTDATVPATVILEDLRRRGYDGGITVLKDHLAEVRPHFAAAQLRQRTTYFPGEVGQGDWWHTGRDLPVGKGATREGFGYVTALPHSAAHAVVYTLSRTTADLLPALLGCFSRLGGVPEVLVVDNDPAVVAEGRGRRARLHPEVAALAGHLGLRIVVLEPGRPQSKGQVERTISYLETSFLPLRTFTSLADLQVQSDDWAGEVAFKRHHRRVGARVADAWRVERGHLRALPDLLPDVDRHTEARVMRDGFVRVGSADYSVPPGLAGRRVQLRVSLTEIVVSCEGAEIARHGRSFVPADVVLAPAHARALRLAREARSRLAAGDVELEAIDLSRYDWLAGVDSDASPSPIEVSESLSGARLPAGVA
jgi:transposase